MAYHLSVWILPQPDGPTSTINSRSAISRLIPCTAGVLSKFLTMLRSATCAICFPLGHPARGRLLNEPTPKPFTTKGNVPSRRAALLALQLSYLSLAKLPRQFCRGAGRVSSTLRELQFDASIVLIVVVARAGT